MIQGRVGLRGESGVEAEATCWLAAAAPPTCAANRRQTGARAPAGSSRFATKKERRGEVGVGSGRKWRGQGRGGGVSLQGDAAGEQMKL